MRLITQFKKEDEAQAFSHLLQDHQVSSYLEASSKGVEVSFLVWAVEEDDFSKAEELLGEFEKNTSHYVEKFQNHRLPNPNTVPPKEEEKPQVVTRVQRSVPRRGLTRLLLFVCIFLFLWVNIEERKVVVEKGLLYLQVGLTPLERTLFYDYPEKYENLAKVLSNLKLESMNHLSMFPSKVQFEVREAEKATTWDGIYPYLEQKVEGKGASLKAPMFEKIRKGEYWRLASPVLLHRDFLHILFNMWWLWVVGFQIEQRLGKLRMLILMIVIAVVSDTAQYLMSGPFFIGFSGVLTGLVGFIWQRQKIAPWEGYPLNRGTIVFLAYFVVAIALLQFIAFILKSAGLIEVSPQIANTAHITGAVTGILLGRTKLFSRMVA